MVFIATFYAHIGAIRFKKACDNKNVPARIMPVPRNLSSSCGTCVRFEQDELPAWEAFPEETEAVVQELDGNYQMLYKAKDS